MSYTLWNDECLSAMKRIPDGSVDMVMCDLPYGTTACKWDAVIPFAPLWEAYRRVCKKNAAIVLTASQPFTSALVMSNADWFRYCWVWEKSSGTGFLDAKKRPMRFHEDISVFYLEQPTYNPQKTSGKPNHGSKVFASKSKIYSGDFGYSETDVSGLKYPRSVQFFQSIPPTGREKVAHPTQKPVALMEYLIKTYTNEGELVLDNTMGSGTTGVACGNLGRRFIGIEQDEKYFQIAQTRISAAYPNDDFC